MTNKSDAMNKSNIMNKKNVLSTFFMPVLFFYNTTLIAAEYDAHGLLDIRVSIIDSLNTSYLAAGQGKLGLNDGKHLSLAQAGTDLVIRWENGLSVHGVINAYVNSETGHHNMVGLTEAYLKYRTIPNTAGYRLQVRAGIFYPQISLENDAYAWASKETLNSSTLNTWIAEEVRVLGSEFKVTRLGRLNKNGFDLSLSASLFISNDPSGALLAWHGWTMGSRQTLWTEKRKIPYFPALNVDGELAGQSRESDPFVEIDNKVGYHVRGEWSLHRKGTLSAGYYDNRATPYKVIKGQYGWDTRFYHIGAKWRLGKNLSLTGQYLLGNTLMRNLQRQDIVNNDYTNGFIAATYKWREWVGNNKHKSTVRIEHFSVTDNDNTEGDDNNEEGYAVTVNHTYRLTKHWFLVSEINAINSDRAARQYENNKEKLIEKQLQLAARYFF